MATAVYALCAVTSMLCAWLLLRGYRSSQARLLLWSGLCFVGLAINNLVLFADNVIVTEVELSMPRLVSALAGIVVSSRPDLRDRLMEEFIAGATMAASVAVAHFFLRFFRQTGDRLFAAFAVAFAVSASTRPAYAAGRRE
jgi:hypothetical protein